MKKSALIQSIIALILVYFIFGLYLFLTQASMIYFPDNQDFHNCFVFRDYEARETNGTRFYYKQSNSESVIIHYHGNAGSACDRSYLREYFEIGNNSVIFVEYAGYSGDKRKPSSNLILNDVKNIVEFVDKNNYSNVLVYGESIGTGPASYHAYVSEVNHLVLVSPFSRLSELAQSKYIIYPVSLILLDEYDNIKWLNQFDGNLAVFHGEQDVIIPLRFSERLIDSIDYANITYNVIIGKGHNDIILSSDMDQKLKEFILYAMG